MKLAFLGLGIMGSRMAIHLIKNDIEIKVWSRSQVSRDQFTYQENVVNSFQEAVNAADIVISMLSKPEAVEDVFFGNEGALSYMKKEAIWIDCSTVNPSFSITSDNQAKKEGMKFIDAPVAGAKPQAEKAELAFFVGGTLENLEKVKPLMEIMGAKVIHIGITGQGSAFKMVVNIMLAQSMAIFSEAVLFGESMGISKEFLLNVLPNLVVSAPFTKFKAESVRNNEYKVQFPLEWMHKDLHLATQTAFETGQPLHLANVTKEMYADAVKQGLSRLDFSAIYKSLKEK